MYHSIASSYNLRFKQFTVTPLVFAEQMAYSSYVGTKDSLSSERSYLYHTLPLGIMHGLRDALFHFDMTGFSRTRAVVFGVITTLLGYIVGTASQKVALRKKVGSTSTEAIFVHGKGNLIP